MLAIVDNYDSFTYNLVQVLRAADEEVWVVRNDAFAPRELLARNPEGIILSPGPGRPEEAGLCPELLQQLPDELPLFGVCLGHQLLVQHYGGSIAVDPEPVHGRATLTEHTGTGLFRGLPSPFLAARYHSLYAKSPLPPALELTAWTAKGTVMGVRHKSLPRFGVQFHPESVLCPEGPRLVHNFLGLLPGRQPGQKQRLP